MAARVDRPAKTRRFPDCFDRKFNASPLFLCNQLRNNTVKIDYGVPSVSFETSYYYYCCYYIRTPTDVCCETLRTVRRTNVGDVDAFTMINVHKYVYK